MKQRAHCSDNESRQSSWNWFQLVISKCTLKSSRMNKHHMSFTLPLCCCLLVFWSPSRSLLCCPPALQRCHWDFHPLHVKWFIHAGGARKTWGASDSPARCQFCEPTLAASVGGSARSTQRTGHHNTFKNIYKWNLLWPFVMTCCFMGFTLTVTWKIHSM